jgi:hypothetical protein
MLDVVNLSQELMTKLRQETELVMSDRLLTRDVLDTRIKELAKKRDEELVRVERWADQQKALIAEIFSAMIAENEADRQRNEEHLSHMKGEPVPQPMQPPMAPRAPQNKQVRQLRTAAE